MNDTASRKLKTIDEEPPPELEPIPERLLTPAHVGNLPWDVYFEGGVLAAKRGTSLVNAISPPLGTPATLYFDKAVLKVGSKGSGGSDTKRRIVTVADYRHQTTVMSKLDAVFYETSLMLSSYKPSEDWTSRVVSLAEQLHKFLDVHWARAQTVIASRRQFDNDGHAGWHPVFRATLLYPVLAHAMVPATQVRVLLAAALTADLAMVGLSNELAKQSQPLSGSQKLQVQSHAGESSALLRKAGVSQELWLNGVESHHGSRQEGQGSSSADEWVHYEALALCDRIAGLATYREGRPAHSLMAALIQSCINPESRTPAGAGELLLRAQGIPPPGSFCSLPSGEKGLVTGTLEFMALTDVEGFPRATPARRTLTREQALKIKPLPQNAARMLAALSERLLNQLWGP
ncbi:hypothetical protein LC612_34940 [Nostoc sp. CHAB 5834]|nr:hypothetical protein [Nostoc sp. CHAB 5834]